MCYNLTTYGDCMKDVVNELLNWYDKNKRLLPWRLDKNPYHVWISEIMLQQTRIEAVLSYYERFMKELPDISSLAKVEEDRLLKLWEGLGYYNRARNLKKAAVIIMEKYHGEFPHTYSQIIQLPGIGEYTASAISSICFGEREVTVDGNVMRVFTRFYNDSSNISKESTKKMIHDHLLSILPSRSGDFNEALMELGEVVCIPNGIPKCLSCPIHSKCLSFQHSNYYQFPVKDVKRDKEEVIMTVLIPIWNDKTIVRKRKDLGLLHGLYEFPNYLGVKEEKEILLLARKFGCVERVEKSISYTHVFTHKKWKMQAYFVFLKDTFCQDMFYSILEIENSFPLPTAFTPFLYVLKEVIK